MKKKYWLIALSSLLLVQIFYYLNIVNAQKKEVKVPETEQSIPSQNFNSSVTIDDTSQNEKYSPNEKKLTIKKNPTAEYFAINPDYVGWLKIEETVIDYPVVRGNDNENYLEYNFYQEKDPLGAIFMDYRNIGMGMDKHTILYGHYSRYGPMFTDLEKYLSEDFLEENPTFTFKDTFTEKTYKIFSVHYGEADPRFLNTVFTENDSSQSINMLKSESIFSSQVPVSENDSIFTLVTCNYVVENGRLFICAVELTD